MTARQLASTRQHRHLLLFGGAGLALLAALSFAGYAQARLNAAQQAELQAQVQQQQAQQHLQQVQMQAQAAQVGVQLLAEAARLGVQPAAWAERRTNLRQALLPREAAEALLLTSARHSGRVFGAEEFELSVTRPDEGLFTVPGEQAAPLRMTLRGLALLRTEVAP